MQTLLWLVPLPPLIAFALISLFARGRRSLSHWMALVSAGLSFLGSMVLFAWAAGRHDLLERPLSSSTNWLPDR